MKPYFPLFALLLFNLIVGLFALPGFGESVDELSQHSYAERTIRGVSELFKTGTWPAYFVEEEPQQGSHGPAFIMTVVFLRDLFLPDGTPIAKLNFSHFFYFVAFQIGVVSLFFLARRWMSELAAFGAAFLFNTQPIILGHAFMNPKDVVFMSFLIASAALGLWMIDRYEVPSPTSGRPPSYGVRQILRQFRCADVWLAGLVLGFASAIRIAAPLVGLVVLAYIMASRKWQALPRFFAYGFIAFGSMIVMWPYLWPDPLGRLIGSLVHSANYPDTHLTLFRGVLYDAKNIPVLYLPVLLIVQLTETTLLFVLAGVFHLLKKVRWLLIALILTWFILPAVAIIGLQVILYDNFRQVFFILPPLFLIAGLGLDWLLSLLQRPIARASLLFLLVVPGLYADVALHPYQYIYYNQLTGGLRGAYRVFELDYWHLAYREAQTYLNQTAAPNANIFVGNSKPSAQTFARSDLIFNAFGGRKRNWEKYDYIIVSTAENDDEKFAGFQTVFVVTRNGIPLIFVKQVH
jgi:hypothetical protein